MDVKLALGEAQRCLNCDMQTAIRRPPVIECDACVDICPMDCISFTENGEEADLRQRLKAPRRISTRTFMSPTPPLTRPQVMVKDEDVLLA